NKSTVGLSWRTASRAKGYQVYMKTNGGGYKKILTTRGRYLNKSGLKINSSYYFKVRAYTSYKGKTYYGAFSNVRKITMTPYVYLVDVMEPYAKSQYLAYVGASGLYMGGKPYYKSFSLWEVGYATFNFQGKYSKVSFYYGGVDGEDHDMTTMFYEDGVLVRTLSRTKDSLPKYYSIDVSNTYQFKIETNAGGFFKTSGFGSVKLYY
ncbi:MAG: hypothetical protein ACI4HZ_00435, partial [Ruminococcus sp.]